MVNVRGVRTTAYFVGSVLAVDLSVTLVTGRDALVPGQTLVLVRLTRRVRIRRCYGYKYLKVHSLQVYCCGAIVRITTCVQATRNELNHEQESPPA